MKKRKKKKKAKSLSNLREGGEKFHHIERWRML